VTNAPHNALYHAFIFVVQLVHKENSAPVLIANRRCIRAGRFFHAQSGPEMGL
jgi:hypothetical protein